MRRLVIDEAEARLRQYNTCVIVGPTGMGKSVGAASILGTAPANSLWLDSSTFEPNSDARSADLIILDDLFDGHPVLDRHWLRTVSSRLVVTTTNPDVAFQILSDRGLANTREPVVEFAGFTPAESKQFLDQVLGELLSDEEKEAIATKVRGSPIALQALPDLLIRRGNVVQWFEWIRNVFGMKSAKMIRPIDAFLPDSGKLNVEGVATALLNQWIEQLRSPQTERLLRVLCRISTLGMGPDTLAYVAGEGTGEVVRRGLASAIDKGFIRRAVNYRFPQIELLVPHEVLRGYFLALPFGGQDQRANERYIKFLTSKPAIDPASQVDAIMAGMQNAFDPDASNESFEVRFNKFTSMLQNVLVEENLPSAQIERIAHLFESKLLVEQLDSCSVVISLAQSVGFLPASTLLAEMIWAGSRCHDTWGRGASIRAAVHHWLATHQFELGISHLRQWFDQYVSCPTRPHYDPFGKREEEDVVVDLDIAAAAGGLCSLGQHEASIERLDVAWAVRQRKHSWCTIAHHSVLIGLADGNRHDLLAHCLERWWPDIPDEPHKAYVQAYLRLKSIATPGPTSLQIGESQYAATVARAAHSESFLKFIRQRQREAMPCI